MQSIKVMGNTFTVEKKYCYEKTVGSGAYGIVIAATDILAQKSVAIKKISKAFEDLVDAKRILRELKFLRNFEHENIIGLIDVPVPNPTGPCRDFDDVYMVTELMDTDLHKVIYSKQKLSSDHIKFFIYQTLKALKYLHSANVIHRDLKPSNLLVNSNCEIKICDFGLARFTHAAVPPTNNFFSQEESNSDSALTEYVVTRWYRAPEVMLRCKQYDSKLDIWSIGCIMAELVLRRPMFPGRDYIHQLQLIVENIGSPSPQQMSFISGEKAKKFIAKQKNSPGLDFQQVFKSLGPEGADFLSLLLTINPFNRPSAEDALLHPYLRDLHCIEEEPSFNFSTAREDELYRDFQIDSVPEEELTKVQIQEGIMNEVSYFH